MTSRAELPTLADAIRILAMDAVQQANAGHPGAPMGMAEIAQALWMHHLRHNPADPAWCNRDRFVLSNGHASMLLYAVLHLTGYNLPLEELKRFRQLHSRTPGHPEVGITEGVEATTGPLGQGLGNAVGMALAETLLAAEFNRPEQGHIIVDHYTYAMVGDGCLMEGISHEVGSLAGTLKLSKLIVLYDDNGISIDGKVKPWFGDNTAQRFAAYGWNVIPDVDGHDVAAVDAALRQARGHAVTRQGGPTLIICRTIIGKGAPNLAGTEKVHGAALGKEEVAATRQALNWPEEEPFKIPPEFYESWNAREQGAAHQEEWQFCFKAYQAHFPQEAAEFTRRMHGDLPEDFKAKTQKLLDDIVAQAQENPPKPMATRRTSQEAIKALVQILPELLGGSADLTGSNNTDWPGAVSINAHIDAQDSASLTGRYLHYGVREFGMAAIMNGLALHGGYLPFGGTFLTFSDYARNALRMAALMKQRVVYILTHDSIGLGEDGPTHQSIEHAPSLRLIPNLSVWRPCDLTETFVAWFAAVRRPASLGMAVHEGGPTALLLSRQNLPFVPRDAPTVAAIARGGYVLRDVLPDTVTHAETQFDAEAFAQTEGVSQTGSGHAARLSHPERSHPERQARAVIIATGSEVTLALSAQALLAKEGIPVRVVSMPSTDVFDQQEDAWQTQVLPKGIPRVVVEASATALWHKYVGLAGRVVGMDRYGESAQLNDLFNYFGFTAEKVVEVVKQVLDEE